MKNITAAAFFALIILSGNLSLSARSASSGDELSDLSMKKGIVLVRITTIHYNDLLPWRAQAGSGYTVLGLVLEGNRILVLSSDIQNASLIEVWKYSSYKKNIAKIEKRDNEANLAVLSINDPDFFKDLKPIESGRDPHMGRVVTASTVDNDFRVHREDVKITDVRGSSDFGVTTIPFLIFRTQEPFSGGGLLLCGIKLCGFIGYSNKENRAEAVLPSIIRSVQNGSDHPFVSQGFELEDLEDPVLREYFKIASDQTGAFVSRVMPGTSAYGVLEEGDIILNIAGRDIDDRGFYNDPKFGLQKGQVLLVRDGDRIRRSGEIIPVTIFRNGRKMEVKITLKSYEGNAERIPTVVEGKPPYLVESGFVFVELSLPYLRDGYGSSWRSRAIELSYLFDTKRIMEKPGKERIILLVGVLPDEVNRGYENLRSIPVQSVNGKPITDLKQLHDILSASNPKHFLMELTSGMKIFFSSENREMANKRIQDRYGLPGLSNFK